jgi:hypothetical protein
MMSLHTFNYFITEMAAPATQLCLPKRNTGDYQPASFYIAKKAQTITTATGPVRALAGDYIVSGKKGRQVLKPAKFFQLFKIVQNPTALPPKGLSSTQPDPKHRKEEISSLLDDIVTHHLDGLLTSKEATKKAWDIGSNQIEFGKRLTAEAARRADFLKSRLHFMTGKDRDFEDFIRKLSRTHPAVIFKLADDYTGSKVSRSVPVALEAIRKEYEERTADMMAHLMHQFHSH